MYAAINGLNQSIIGPTARPLQSIARGQMLRQIIDAADTLWPVDIRAQRNILNIFSARGDDELPISEYIAILSDGFALDKYSETAIPAMHLVTAVLSSNWIEHGNYFELVKMYSILAISAACYQARWKRMKRKDVRFIEEIVFDIRSHLRNFVRDLMDNFNGKPLLNDNVFAEFAYYHPRKKMIAGLVSAAMLDKGLEFDDATRDFLWEFVCKQKHREFLLSEGIVPFCLAEFWALSNIQGSMEPHRRLFSLVQGIIECNDSEVTEKQLPGPYYSLREVVETKYKPFLGTSFLDIDQDSHYRRSWYIEPLFLLLARRNYKMLCQLLWPKLTKFVHARTRLSSVVEFGPAAAATAIAEERILDTTIQKTWDDVISDAQEEATPLVPASLLDRPSLLLLYCLFVPQRLDRDVVLWLDRQFCRTWY